MLKKELENQVTFFIWTNKNINLHKYVFRTVLFIYLMHLLSICKVKLFLLEGIGPLAPPVAQPLAQIFFFMMYLFLSQK